MPIPTYDVFIDPLLRVLVAHPEGIRAADAQDLVADVARLTADDRASLLPSGKQAVYKNRIGWAHDRLKRAGYSSSPRRAWWTITREGIAFAARHPMSLPQEVIDLIAHVAADSRVQRVAEDSKHNDDLTVVPFESPSTTSPEERIEAAVKELHEGVAGDLLDLIAANTAGSCSRTATMSSSTRSGRSSRKRLESRKSSQGHPTEVSYRPAADVPYPRGAA